MMKMPRLNERFKFALLMLGLIVIFLTLLASICWLVAPASAASIATPCPIALKLHTVPDGFAAGFHVSLLDSLGTPFIQTIADQDGVVMFELGGVVECKPYTATVIECDSNPACTQTVSFNPSGLTDWYLSFISPTTTTTMVPETTTTMTTLCPECPGCPSQDLTQTIAVSGGLFAVLGYIINYLIQRWNVSKGKIRIQAYLPYVTSTGKNSFHWVTKYESTKDKSGNIKVSEK